ncbi:hypothetical protein TEA_010894 [Camellia sinensis var. sinensis]|uniref:Rieske domain-containing protein n=1 Tax=Camellia sinensis var. sinensis TaxID=542762 RepID=A0A4V3WNE2_CAMSN|nr:hypothetical protein TEA_010894 [Camellia sinensis var. sinensis]
MLNQRLPNSSLSSIHKNKAEFRLFTATSSSSTFSTELANPPEEEVEIDRQGEKFDWYAQWYPVVPVCDLDKRVPHAKKVMGLDVVVWWDRNESAWKVFDDMCPHRLAPLSEGRIDQWGRLQCVYHGWCFNGSGDCKFIPEAPPDGPPVHAFKKACVAAYPSTEWGHSKFVAPCIFSAFTPLVADQTNGSVSSAGTKEERKIMDIGPSNWQKACFVPTKSDALVVSFRRWLNKYAGGQVDWGTKFSGALPPTPPREQLLDRYWSHVVNCRSCNVAYKGRYGCYGIVTTATAAATADTPVNLNHTAKVAVTGGGNCQNHYVTALRNGCGRFLKPWLQVMSIASIGIVAAKQNMLSAAARNTLISFAVLSFVASRWLAHFVYKNFRYHNYNHAQGGWLTLSTRISVTTTTPMAYPESYISVT